MDCVEEYAEELVGEWGNPPAPNMIPVEDEEYINNVRSALKRDLPNIKHVPEHGRVMVMVCGGPTSKMYLEEIRAKSQDPNCDIFCSNKTHDWLISEGIIPHTHFIIDPKPEKIKDVAHPHKDVRYLIGVGCVPEVFDILKGYNVHRLFCASGVGKDTGNKMTDIQMFFALFDSSEFAVLDGGSMAGLRAMNLANVLGYLTVEFYGFDSCYFETDSKGEPIYYSYDKKRKENIMEAQTDSGRMFLTTPVFASQARQYIKWKHALAWIKFIIHGDSLTAEIDRLDEEKNRPKGCRISDYMMRLNSDMHKGNEDYGCSKDTDVGLSVHVGRMCVLVGEMLKKEPSVDILDYGCGKGKFKEMWPPINHAYIRQYDPCVDEFSAEPSPADIVVCLDVLEHVELDCIHDVLAHIESLTKKICYVSIHTKAAKKYYSDGQNTHLIIADAEWWTPILRKYFDLVESNVTKAHFNAVLQKKGLVCQL